MDNTLLSESWGVGVGKGAPSPRSPRGIQPTEHLKVDWVSTNIQISLAASPRAKAPRIRTLHCKFHTVPLKGTQSNMDLKATTKLPDENPSKLSVNVFQFNFYVVLHLLFKISMARKLIIFHKYSISPAVGSEM